MPQPMRLLQLGGSLEAFEVAERLNALSGIDIVTSFAGRTKRRRAIAGRDRVGHFGGVEGLIRYCKDQYIGGIIDATHPFAQQMKARAAAAAKFLGLPIIHFERELWRPEPGDRWISVLDAGSAAEAIPDAFGLCFLTLGRQEIGPFAARPDLALLIRVIDRPEHEFKHPKHRWLEARGPFTLEGERALFAKEPIRALICKNSGGEAARAKLLVAREAGVPVYMVDRPPLPEGPKFHHPDEIVPWLAKVRK